MKFSAPRFSLLAALYCFVSHCIALYYDFRSPNGLMFEQDYQVLPGSALVNYEPALFISGQVSTVKRNLATSGYTKSRTAALKWSKCGLTTLLVQGYDPPCDVTVYVDVSLDPGPTSKMDTSTENLASSSFCLNESHLHKNTHRSILYSQYELLRLRRSGNESSNCVPFRTLKALQIFRYRGKRAGRDRLVAIHLLRYILTYARLTANKAIQFQYESLHTRIDLAGVE